MYLNCVINTKLKCCVAQISIVRKLPQASSLQTTHLHMLQELYRVQANVANLPNLPNWPRPMKESIHLIGGLLDNVCHVWAYLSVSQFWTCQMCDMKSSNGWTFMVLYSFNGWTQIVQIPVFRQISLKKFRKPKIADFWRDKNTKIRL